MARQAAAVNLGSGDRLPDAGLGRRSPRPWAGGFLHRHRKPIILTVSFLAGLVAMLSTLYSFSVMPPGLHSRSVTVGVAATHVMVDTQPALVSNTAATSVDFDTYTKEATLLANVLASDPVRYMIAREMHVNADLVTARARITGVAIGAYTDQLAEQRANEILVANRPYKLEMQSDPNLPVFAIYGQAPTAASAERIANVAVGALRRYIASNRSVTGMGRSQRVVLKQLGLAGGAVVNGQATLEMVVLAFLVGFGVTLSLLVGILRTRRGFIAAGHAKAAQDTTGDDGPDRPRPLESMASVGGDWPHTTRVMPWLVATFLVVIWLVPFNDIQLSVSLPFDLKFDRILLPVLFLGWVLSIAAGGPGAPRPRLTRIHVGILAFLGVVGLGIVLDAGTLTQALEFNLASKKLTLLVSYGLMFAIIASSVRRTELPAFVKFSLVLAVIVAVGSIWEYRFHYNIFYDMSSRILGKIFEVTPYDPNTVDELGRRMVRGPSDHPLELVGILVMMFPLALIGILRSSRRRDRFLYGLAACLLLAAMVSTDRKTALLAPLAVLLIIGYHYRSKLLRLAPLVLVLVIAVHALSPGALGTIVDQLNPHNLGVGTVSDRTSDYDAVRPDLWSHLAFGRGYGTYDHVNYRTLDSDILNRLIDTGILGICTFVFMLGCVVSVARRVIRGGDPDIAPIALAVAGSTAAYFVLCFLFDVSSFPHVPYIMFSLAGLLAAAEAAPRRAASPRLAFTGAARAGTSGTGGRIPALVPERELSYAGKPDS